MANALLSFMAMWCVVVIHAPLHVAGEKSALYSLAVPALTQWAVLWFFLLSGYFFMRTLGTYSTGEIVRKKTNSLLLPYLAWCLFGALVSCLVRPVGQLFADPFGFLSCFPTGNPTLWFVRVLMAYMAFSLLLWSLLGKSGVLKSRRFALPCFYVSYFAFISPFCAYLGG